MLPFEILTKITHKIQQEEELARKMVKFCFYLINPLSVWFDILHLNSFLHIDGNRVLDEIPPDF